MYNNLLQRILFPSLSIYFFPHFFTFFPIPKSKFRRIMGKNGDFFYFENRKFVSLSFHILFSPFLPIPKSKFRCVLGKNGVGPPQVIVNVKLVLCVVNLFIIINLLLCALWMVISIMVIVLAFVKTRVSIFNQVQFLTGCVQLVPGSFSML